MGKTRKRGGSRRKRGGFMQNALNQLQANLKEVANKAKKEADEAHRTTMGVITDAHAKGTAAIAQAKNTANAGFAAVQAQAAKAQGALVSGAHSVEKQAGQVAKVGGRRRRHRTHRRKHRRKHRRTHKRHRRRTHRRRR